MQNAINMLDSEDSFIFMPNVFNDEDLGSYYIHEAGMYDLEAMGTLANYIDYEAFGRDIRLDGYGVTYGTNGCIQQVDDVSENYTGDKDIPDECRITGDAMHIVQDKLALKNTELDTEEGYSFIDGVRNNLKPEKDITEKKLQSSNIATMERFIRKMLLTGYVVNLDLKPVNKIVSLLSYCSNNLNQLARRANSYAPNRSEVVLGEPRQELPITREDIDELSKVHDQMLDVTMLLLEKVGKL